VRPRLYLNKAFSFGGIHPEKPQRILLIGFGLWIFRGTHLLRISPLSPELFLFDLSARLNPDTHIA
jgi:hypothetical protein